MENRKIMPEIKNISWEEVDMAAMRVAKEIATVMKCRTHVGIYGVPRGGEVVLRAVYASLLIICPEIRWYITEQVLTADVYVDDLIDSGATKAKYPAKPFFALFKKSPGEGWYVFPWDNENTADGQDVVIRMLQLIGEDPNREGLLKTPERVVRSWKELFGGYKLNAVDILKSAIFTSNNSEMVVVKDIEFYSTCEHHCQVFFGRVDIGYIPQGSVLGASKLPRAVEVFARRLQIQENLTEQIADAIEEAIEPEGVAVKITAKHMCMCARGVSKQKSEMVTSSLRKAFKEPHVRAEWFKLIE